MKNFIYRFEPMKGYVVLDTVRVNGTRYMQASGEILPYIGDDFKTMRDISLLDRKEAVKALQRVVERYTKGIGYQGSENIWYFNINHDGVDCFKKLYFQYD